ncbi:laccase 3 [Mycena albidolilacea]|uniref:Laccase 3 n=1 Tax=Mycena albidolilacea TaxID=1033008 RepID=A0AAD6YYW4_9AGAR|nr:laccase 3 [Mycena albidolilacea]
MIRLSSAFVFLSAFSTAYAAIGPVGGLEISNKHIAPDGFPRSAVLAGGTFPGPLIKANKGDTLAINVMDDLTDNTMLTSTSIHWHGIFQEKTNWDDGPAFITQCPILPKNSFLYNFKVPDQAGTFWYHSHLSTQYCDGLRGPLVIYDPKDPQKHLYDIDDESTIITLSDWYHYPSPQHPQIPVFNSTLINGLGRYAGGPLSKLAVISVVPKKRYRFRLISMSCDPNWIFSIDGHQLTVIEADGVEVQPITVDSIQIFAAQRYSFVLNANQKADNYWIRAQPTLPGSNTGFANATNSAILRYAGARVADPTTSAVASTLPLLETNLHPLVQTPVPGAPHPGGADLVLNLVITLDTADFRFALNNVSFVPPNAPVLLQILSGAHTAQDLMPKGSIIELPPNKVIEVSIPGGSPGAPHPFHLHGHNFHVIRSAGNATYNFVNPVVRDTTSTGEATSDLTTFRFVTDNAGPWLLHCHIDWHLDIGLAVVFAENIQQIAQEKPPAAWNNLCPLYEASLNNRSDTKPPCKDKNHY